MGELKVGVFLGQNLPSYWAHSFNVMKMAQGFKGVGCKVEVVTAENVDTIKLKKEIKNLYFHYGVDSNIQIKYLSPSKEAFLNGKTRYDRTFCQAACKYAKEQEFDFVYCRNHLLAYMMIKAGIPTFLESHHTDYEDPIRKKIYETAKHSSFRGLITIHESIKKEHIQRGIPKDKVLVLEDGVDLERFQISDDRQKWRESLGLDKNKVYAVYCGHLYPEKGIEVILQTAKKLQHCKQLGFLMVGGLEKDQLHWEKMCKEQEISNVQFTGFVPNSKVPAYLKAADLLLLAYKIKNMKYRVMDINTTSPLKLFEYMASKRPIVATNIPTISKVLKQESNALLVRPDDIGHFGSAITRLMDDRDLCTRLGKQAYEDSKKYSWDQRCKQIVKLYHKHG